MPVKGPRTALRVDWASGDLRANRGISRAAVAVLTPADRFESGFDLAFFQEITT